MRDLITSPVRKLRSKGAWEEPASINDVIVVHEVKLALSDWFKVTDKSKQVIVGSLARSYWLIPEVCQLLGFLVDDQESLPLGELEGFELRVNRAASRYYLHKKTGVSFTAYHALYENSVYATMSSVLQAKISEEAKLVGGLRVATPEALICLHGFWMNHQNKAYISSLCNRLGPIALPERLEPWLDAMGKVPSEPLRSFLMKEGWTNG